MQTIIKFNQGLFHYFIYSPLKYETIRDFGSRSLPDLGYQITQLLWQLRLDQDIRSHKADSKIVNLICLMRVVIRQKKHHALYTALPNNQEACACTVYRPTNVNKQICVHVTDFGKLGNFSVRSNSKATEYWHYN